MSDTSMASLREPVMTHCHTASPTSLRKVVTTPCVAAFLLFYHKVYQNWCCCYVICIPKTVSGNTCMSPWHLVTHLQICKAFYLGSVIKIDKWVPFIINLTSRMFCPMNNRSTNDTLVCLSMSSFRSYCFFYQFVMLGLLFCNPFSYIFAVVNCQSA